MLSTHHSDGGASNPSGYVGACMTAGVFTTDSYPSAYRGRFLYGDYTYNTILAATVDDNDELVEVVVAGSAVTDVDEVVLVLVEVLLLDVEVLVDELVLVEDVLLLDDELVLLDVEVLLDVDVLVDELVLVVVTLQPPPLTGHAAARTRFSSST